MGNPVAILCTVFKNGTLTMMARVDGWDAAPIVIADITAIAYTLSLLEEHDPDAATAITGHTAVAVSPGDALFDTLQTDAVWTVDETGFNFKYTLDVSTAAAFAIAGRRYRVEFTLTPAAGQDIRLRFQPAVI